MVTITVGTVKAIFNFEVYIPKYIRVIKKKKLRVLWTLTWQHFNNIQDISYFA